MAVSYNKLWKLLIDKGISQASLRKEINLAPNTLTRMRKNLPVSLTVLERVCETLQVDIGDIVSIDYEKSKDIESLNGNEISPNEGR